MSKIDVPMGSDVTWWERLFKNPFQDGDIVTIPAGHIAWPVAMKGVSVNIDHELSIEAVYCREGYYWGNYEQGNVGYWDEDGNTVLVPLSRELLEVNGKPIIMQDPPA